MLHKRGLTRGSAVDLIKLLLICLAALVIVLPGIRDKTMLVYDEYVSYLIANNSRDGGMQMTLEDNVLYQNAREPFMNGLTVAPSARFNYGQVFENASHDMHPPLYNAVLHTVCSFSPNQYSKYFGAAVNLLFLFLMLFVAYRLCGLLGIVQGQRVLICLCVALMPGVIEIVQFMRMYTAAMFWVLLFTYVNLKWLKANAYTLREAVSVALACAGGALTHYYFLIFAVLQCVVIGLYLLARREYKRFGLYAATFAVAACLCVAIFPAMPRQLFHSSLTPVAVQNIAQSGGRLAKLNAFLYLVNTRLCANQFWPMAAVGLGLIFIGWRPAGTSKPLHALRLGLEKHFLWICLALPALLYFLVISQLAFYAGTNYLSLIYPLLIILEVKIIARFCAALCRSSVHAGTRLATVLCVLLLLNAYDVCPMVYSESGADDLFQALANHTGAPSVCVYQDLLLPVDAYDVVKETDGVVFSTPANLAKLPLSLPSADNGLWVEVEYGIDPEQTLKALQALYPALTACEAIGQCNSYAVYLLQ